MRTEQCTLSFPKSFFASSLASLHFPRSIPHDLPRIIFVLADYCATQRQKTTMLRPRPSSSSSSSSLAPAAGKSVQIGWITVQWHIAEPPFTLVRRHDIHQGTFFFPQVELSSRTKKSPYKRVLNSYEPIRESKGRATSWTFLPPLQSGSPFFCCGGGKDDK